MKTFTLLKYVALSCSILLSSGYVWYRSGGTFSIGAPANGVMQTRPQADSAPAAQPHANVSAVQPAQPAVESEFEPEYPVISKRESEPQILPGSKSALIFEPAPPAPSPPAGTKTVTTVSPETSPQQELMLMIERKPNGSARDARTNPPVTTPPRTIMYSSKSGRMELPLPTPTPAPTQPQQQQRPARTFMPGSKSAEVLPSR